MVIVGAGGFGREAADVVEAVNSAAGTPLWELSGFYDDAPAEKNLTRLRQRGLAYLGPIPQEWDGTDISFVIGIGSPAVREILAARLERLGWEPAVLVHPAAVVGSRSLLGAGSVVCGGVQVSTNVQLGRHVHLNPNATIGHDAVLEDFVSVNPAVTVSGEVRVRTGTLLGAGSVVLQGLEVGPGALVGAAACVVRDVPADATVKGVPAR
ncbi:acetyltransferase [Citricoccus sp. SGAir0253]|nr:acetyltransferase [Citricoccus sp. SGAir0253]